MQLMVIRVKMYGACDLDPKFLSEKIVSYREQSLNVQQLKVEANLNNFFFFNGVCA